ncbi:MAG: EAL domain-containing protein [Gammaproteobacteria bacterium]|nr:EAL domain-containing protein [Gammaproteobacteria bacterium]
MNSQDLPVANLLSLYQLTAQDAELIIQNMRDTLYRVDETGRLVYVSPSAEELTGYSRRELIGMVVTDIYMYPEKREEFLERLKTGNGILDNYEVELRHKKGHGVWVLINVRYFHDNHGKLAGIEGIIRDITSRKLTEQALDYEREKAEVTLKSIADGVITTDVHGHIEYLNPTATTITGWQLAAAKGMHIETVYHPISDSELLQVSNPVTECLRTGNSVMFTNIRLLTRQDGREFAIRDSASPIRNREGAIIGVVLIIHDVTHIRDMSQQLAFQASHDAHTGLLNRRAFEQHVLQALEASHTQGIQHVLCYMDLDQFKIINDTCGHIAGDTMLVQLAHTMQSFVRDGDTIARLGGDEFGLLLENCPLERGLEIAEEIRESIASFRFVWQEKMFEIGISIGMVVLEQSSGDVTDVLSKADSACFIAKDKGRNCVYIYQDEGKGLSPQHREMHWAHEIQRAFQENYFCLYAQDIVPLNGASERHCEILLRINSGEELVPPMAFIPAAERYSLMQKIDRWVIQKTLLQLAQMQAMQPLDRIYSINLSGSTIADAGFCNFLLSALGEYGVPSQNLCFEITETAAISNLTNAIRLIGSVRDYGCQFALDDFGCGLSSFSYLKNLPVQYLKIDGSFVRDIHKDRINYSMVSAINNIGHVMGLKTIAEFVESPAIMPKLREIGVDYAQGNHIGEPQPWACPSAVGGAV